MFSIEMWSNEYHIRITPPPFTEYVSLDKVKDLPFYDIHITRKDPKFDVHYYVDPVKEFLKIDLSERNPLKHPKDKENLTKEETVFQVEHLSYWHRVTLEKQSMPYWKLSKQHIEEILEIIFNN